MPAFTPQPQSVTALWLVVYSYYRSTGGRRLSRSAAVVHSVTFYAELSSYSAAALTTDWYPECSRSLPKFNQLFSGPQST